ncbi:MAG TPA: 2-oxoglutarate oxidoreductase [Candidatus Wirthbacteria bacterium]|nr:2-oxoglutarate oxidoreductase [Candidatus Wirthbacteria bacterium]
MTTVAQKPNSFFEGSSHYCPGCGHGVIHRLITEVIDELDIIKNTIGVAPVGCSILAYDYIRVDFVEALHGRAPAVATGIKRMLPDKIVFSYQGDGDILSIGTAEIIHAANRGENLTAIFVNNAIYGMTGGQMAPTSLIGQKTTTSPFGRGGNFEGPPIKGVELLDALPTPHYLERVSVHDAKQVLKAKKAIKKAFINQIEGKGFSLVEVLSICPTNWKMNAVESKAWLEENMLAYYPLGVVRDLDKV